MSKKLFLTLLVIIVLPTSVTLAAITHGKVSLTHIENSITSSDESDDQDLDDEDNEDHDDDLDDEDNEDHDDDLDDEDNEDHDDENSESEAQEKIQDAEEEILEAQTVITEKEAEDKDVTKALQRLQEAEELLAQAQTAFEAKNYQEAETLARKAKHTAMYSRGKDIKSNNEQSTLGREFGECISDAAQKSEEKFSLFNECFEDFDKAVSKFVEDKLSEEDKAINQNFDEALSELATKQDKQIQDLLLKLAEFNISGIEEEDSLSDIEEILNSNDDPKEQIKELRKIIADIKKESTDKKFHDGLIPFKDTDDEEWFFNFVDQMQSESCISGFRDQNGNELGEFRPGNQVLFGESMKFVLECILNQQPENTNKNEFWAKGHAQKLQNEFSELLSNDLKDRLENALNDDKEYNKPVTRGELIQMIVDVLDLEIPNAQQAPFKDVPLAHANANAINYALKIGVISGDEETNNFRPNEVPNRAEVAKIITLAKQLF